MKLLALAAAVSLLSSQVSAEDSKITISERQKLMRQLNWMHGDWTGAGWINLGPNGRREFSYSQSVRPGLNNLVLVLNGSAIPEGDREPIHSALRIISYGPHDVLFRWREFASSDRERSNEAFLNGNSLTVGFPPLADEYVQLGAVPGKFGFLVLSESWVRITISLNTQDEWIETAELRRSIEGPDDWVTLYQLVLRKSPPAQTSD